MSLLPFLKPRSSQSGVVTPVTKMRSMSGLGDAPSNYQDTDDGLRICSRLLIHAVAAGDEEAVGDALRTAFRIMESEPHSEYPHEGE